MTACRPVSGCRDLWACAGKPSTDRSPGYWTLAGAGHRRQPHGQCKLTRGPQRFGPPAAAHSP